MPPAFAPIHVFDVLSDTPVPVDAPVIAIVGEDRFLKRLVVQHLLKSLPSCAKYVGDDCDWRDLRDELATVSLFGSRTRAVLVEDADTFVTRHRSQLEKLVARPFADSVLALDVASLPSNTNLYKAIVAHGTLIECQPPVVTRGKSKSTDVLRMKQWLERWAVRQHRVTFTPPAFSLLIDLVGWEFGLLDQELAKLALFAQDEPLGPEVVQRVVGGWRSQTTWEMIDAAVDGNASSALLQLDHLLQSGESPLALLGSMAWSLRRFALATRIYEHQERLGRRPQLVTALQAAGFQSWQATAVTRAEGQLKQLSRLRSRQLFQWLLDLDLSLKGSHSSPDRSRFALEQLMLRLARQSRPRTP